MAYTRINLLNAVGSIDTSYVLAVDPPAGSSGDTLQLPLTQLLVAEGTVTGASVSAQTFSKGIVLGAGTSSLPAFQMANGTNLTTLVQGAVEFNGYNMNVAVGNTPVRLSIGIGAGSVDTNLVFGVGSFASNTTGYRNIAIGIDALAVNTTGKENTAIGHFSLTSNVDGNDNVAFGGYALCTNISGLRQTAIGSGALHHSNTSDNTAVGCSAGSSITTGTYNTLIGNNAATDTATDSNSIVIGGNAVGAGSNTTVIGRTTQTNTIIAGGDFTVASGDVIISTTGKGLTSAQASLAISNTAGSVDVTTHSDAGDDFTVNATDLIVEGGTGDTVVGNDLFFNESVELSHTIGYNSTTTNGSFIISARGAAISLYGNDHGGSGQLELYGGTKTTSDINFYTHAIKHFIIDYNSNCEVTKGNLVIGTTAKGLTSAQASLLISNTTGGVNVTTHTDAGDDFTVNTNALVVEGDTGNVNIGLGNITLTDGGVKGGNWVKLIIDTDFNDDPVSESTVTMVTDQTSNVKIGTPIKFTLGGTATNPGTYYAICTAITSSLLTINGAPLEVDDGDLTALYYDDTRSPIQLDFFIAGVYGDAIDTALLSNDMNSYFTWKGKKAYLVNFSAVQKTVDTGTEPKINVRINSADVSSNDSNNGIQLGATATWVDNPAVAINTANYGINNGGSMEIHCPVAGGTGDASDLTTSCIFVEE